MQEHVLDDGVFIRSMASRGHLGGLSWAAPQGLLVLDAAGFDIVVVETVGVGQAEVEIASTADTTLVVLVPGMGDAIQAAKAGILEIADVFCVNRADHEGVDRTVRQLREMQRLGEGRREAVAGGRGDAGEGHGEWLSPIHKTIATTAYGISGLVDAVDDHYAWLRGSGRLQARRLHRARLQLREIALGEVRARLAAIGTVGEGELVEKLAQQVADRQLDPYTAADLLVAELDT